MFARLILNVFETLFTMRLYTGQDTTTSGFDAVLVIGDGGE